MPGIEISQLPVKNILDTTDLFPVAIPPYQVPGSNRHIPGSVLLNLRPVYSESCIQGNTNHLAGSSVIPGQNLILSAGTYILNWSSSVLDGVAFGGNSLNIGYNINPLITTYDPSDIVVFCSQRFFSLQSAQERVPFHITGRIIIPAGQSWIVKPTVNNNNSPLMSIGAENILTALKIA